MLETIIFSAALNKKEYAIVFTKIWSFKWILLTVAVPKNYNIPEENSSYKYSKRAAIGESIAAPVLQVQMGAIALLKNLL